MAGSVGGRCSCHTVGARHGTLHAVPRRRTAVTPCAWRRGLPPPSPGSPSGSAVHRCGNSITQGQGGHGHPAGRMQPHTSRNTLSRCRGWTSLCQHGNACISILGLHLQSVGLGGGGDGAVHIPILAQLLRLPHQLRNFRRQHVDVCLQEVTSRLQTHR